MVAIAMFFQIIIFGLVLYAPYRPKPVAIAGYFGIMIVLWAVLARMNI